MLRNLLILVLAVAVFWLAADVLLHEQRQTSERSSVPQPVPQTELEPIVPPAIGDQPNRVADISVHTVDELERVFARVEQLLDRPRSEGEAALVSLVLHGPEVEFFALGNYEKYKAVVDHAAKLAALGGVDIAVCKTQMNNLGIGADEMPSFLRQVPFGPDEVERLIDSGFVYM